MELPPAIEKERPVISPAFWVLAAALLFSGWAATVGWNNRSLPGVEFRQTQTAISAHFIQQEQNFSLSYPTPVLGKPWSIPMEFPLYQWTTVMVSDVTGIPLTQAGRLVSLACFYLTLPAVFILLGYWEKRIDRRQLLLALIVCSPFYLFYSRAFLIETMALMFSVWFLLAFIRCLETSRWTWGVVAALVGVGAALVKITTFGLYLVPAGLWFLGALWRVRLSARNSSSRDVLRLVTLGAIITLIPVGTGWWWIRYSDAVKQLNPLADFLVSANMTGWHFGTAETRFSARVWQGHWRIISESVLWLPLLIVGIGLIGRIAASRWRVIGICLGCFVGVQVLFPELYAWHDYYYVANGLFLLVALGVGLVALFDSRLPRWGAWVAVGAVMSGQVYHYFAHYYPEQSRVFHGVNGLTQALNTLTERDDVLLICGDDWNSMVPYYAKRRALMVRWDQEQNEANLNRAFAALKGERVGALVARKGLAEDALVLRLAIESFDFDPTPVLQWRDEFIYFPKDRLEHVYDFQVKASFDSVFWATRTGPKEIQLTGAWIPTKGLKDFQLHPFEYMQPRPVRFFTTFGLGLDMNGGQVHFGAHPLTQVCFSVPAGPRQLRTEIGIGPGAYENTPPGEATDGVQLTISLLFPNQEEKVIYSRYVNPRDNEADRGRLPVSVDFDMPENAEVKLSVDAGPANNSVRDWAFLGKLTIE